MLQNYNSVMSFFSLSRPSSITFLDRLRNYSISSTKSIDLSYEWNFNWKKMSKCVSEKTKQSRRLQGVIVTIIPNISLLAGNTEQLNSWYGTM